LNWHGGTESFSIHMYLGAFNYFDLTEFVELIRQLEIAEPRTWQLFVEEADDVGIREIDLFPNIGHND